MRTLTIIWASALMLTAAMPVLAASLSDISTNKNKGAIEYLNGKGVIGGYPDGTFRPMNTVNRAELLKILAGGKGASPAAETYKNCFPDVTNEWFAPYVCYAKEQGWVGGYPDGTFRPALTVNKVEAIKMIVKSEGFDVPDNVSNLIYCDTEATAWYAPYVQAAFEKGILEEESGSLGVSTDMLRGSVAENIYRSSVIRENALQRFTDSTDISSSSSSSKQMSYSFPLNLVNNPQWEIRITAPEDYLEQPIFEVARYHSTLKTSAYFRDLKTGEIGNSLAGYDAQFQQRYDTKDEYLEIKYCTYRYYEIKVGQICDYWRIPAQMDASSVMGNVGTEILFSEADDEFEVEIMSKSGSETECNVRGKLEQGQKIYYTKESTFYENLGNFKCFKSEQSAIQDGYTKSYR